MRDPFSMNPNSPDGAMFCFDAIPRNLFAEILRLVAELRPPADAVPG